MVSLGPNSGKGMVSVVVCAKAADPKPIAITRPISKQRNMFFFAGIPMLQYTNLALIIIPERPESNPFGCLSICKDG
jgi:hypothetical protein